MVLQKMDTLIEQKTPHFELPMLIICYANVKNKVPTTIIELIN